MIYAPALAKKSVAAFGALLILTANPAAAGDSVTLRLDDVRAEPGEVVAVVLRTYAPRGMEQGEICFRATAQSNLQVSSFEAGKKPAPVGANGKSAWSKSASMPMPFAALEAVDVPSAQGDAVNVVAFDELSQTTLLQFLSPSGSVNESDGPIAIFYFRVSSLLAGEHEFTLELDMADTYLVDADGETVEIEPRSGRLEVRSPGDPLRLEAADAEVAAGATADLGTQTMLAMPIAGGQLTYTFDPEFVAGTPSVTVDPQYGLAFYTVDASVPGRVVVEFQSPDGSLNANPGEIFTLHLPTSPTLPDGSETPVVLDPASTYMVDLEGRWVDLDLRDGELEIDG